MPALSGLRARERNLDFFRVTELASDAYVCLPSLTTSACQDEGSSVGFYDASAGGGRMTILGRNKTHEGAVVMARLRLDVESNSRNGMLSRVEP
jgi:hypothetical protein